MRAVSIFCLFVAGLSSLPLSVAAEEEIRLDGPVLIFDTENVEDDPDADISGDDVGVILKLLRGNPDIRTVRLNSYGGDIYAGSRLADILIDFEVETEVKDVCDSTCVTLFLAGTKRRLPRGAKIGFHQTSWSPDGVKSYYERRSKDEGWETPFVFSSWLYQDTQTEIYERLTYMIERGVDPVFAIETLRRQGSSVWYPSRQELLAAGVLTE